MPAIHTDRSKSSQRVKTTRQASVPKKVIQRPKAVNVKDVVMTPANAKPQKAKKEKLVPVFSQKTTMSATQSQNTQEPENLLPTIVPKKPMAAFMHFNIDNIKVHLAKGSNIKNKHIFVDTGKKWKLMKDEQKKKYVKMAEQDKIRYQKEMDQLEKKGYFVNSNGIKSTNIKPELKNFPKHTVMPKRVSKPFNFFMKLGHDAFRKANPNLAQKEIFDKMHQSWKNLSDSDKKKFENMAAKDVKRHEKEVEQLRTQGFFVNSDGVKSYQLKKKQTREEIQQNSEQRAKIAEKEKAKKLKQKEKAAKVALRAKEKAAKIAIREKAAKAKAQKDSKVLDRSSIQAGFLLYQELQLHTFVAKAEGRTENSKLSHAKSALKQKWNSLADQTKIKYCKSAQERLNSKKPVLKKRSKPDAPQKSEKEVKSQFGAIKDNKRQKKVQK